MAQDLVIIPGTTWEFYVPGLPSQANTKINQINPTLASGDAKFSYAGGALTTLATTPTVAPAGGTQVKVTITGAESTAWVVGKQVNVFLVDASGAEWCDVGVIAVVGEDIDLSDLATTTALATVDGKLPAALVGGRIDASVGAMAAGVVTATAVATGAIDADALATDAAAEIADAVWDEALAGHAVAGSTGAALTAAGSAGDPWSTELPAAYTGDQAGALFTDLWAVMAGDAEADDAANPTQVAYDDPDGTERVIHSLTPTTRTKTP